MPPHVRVRGGAYEYNRAPGPPAEEEAVHDQAVDQD